MEEKTLNIYIYLEYRKYLQDYYLLKKKQNNLFSFRVFSRMAGVNTPNFLQLLIQGKRNLKESTITSVSKAIGHNEEEAAYFRLLVKFDQANVVEEKTDYFLQLSKIRKPYKINNITDIQFEHYRCWYYKAIRELLAFYPFYPDEQYAYRNLATILRPAIKQKEASTAIKHMLKLGLLKKDESNRIVPTARFITTGDEVNSLFVRKFHEAMMEIAKESQDNFPPDKRDVSCLTVSISDEGFDIIKKEIQLFRKQLLEIVKRDDNPKNVFQINFQLFPLTNTKRTGKVL
jgi:uncharacterized protein (TIGR02147 family)